MGEMRGGDCERCRRMRTTTLTSFSGQWLCGACKGMTVEQQVGAIVRFHGTAHPDVLVAMGSNEADVLAALAPKPATPLAPDVVSKTFDDVQPWVSAVLHTVAYGFVARMALESGLSLALGFWAAIHAGYGAVSIRRVVMERRRRRDEATLRSGSNASPLMLPVRTSSQMAADVEEKVTALEADVEKHRSILEPQRFNVVPSSPRVRAHLVDDS